MGGLLDRAATVRKACPSGHARKTSPAREGRIAGVVPARPRGAFPMTRLQTSLIVLAMALTAPLAWRSWCRQPPPEETITGREFLLLTQQTSGASYTFDQATARALDSTHL